MSAVDYVWLAWLIILTLMLIIGGLVTLYQIDQLRRAIAGLPDEVVAMLIYGRRGGEQTNIGTMYSGRDNYLGNRIREKQDE